MLTMVRTLIFDFDYTLVDSSPGVIDCIDFALRGLGLPSVSDKSARQTIGLSLPDTLVALAGPQHAQKGAAFARLFVQRADQVMVAKTALLPSVAATIRRLKRQGMALGIVSTKFRYRIKATLQRENLLELFDVIVGGEDVSSHKPDPESLALALAKLRASQGILYVGDSVTDAETARRAAVPFVAVLSGVTPQEAFRAYDPVAVLPNLSQLPGLLAGSRCVPSSTRPAIDPGPP
jgi:phosphoglycolate phosphatase